MKKVINFLIFLFIIVTSLQGQTIETVDVYSRKMKKDIRNTIILPEGYETSANKRYPVVYLLNGYGGDYKTFITKTKKSLSQDATKWDVIFVCPDGQDSWYWNSPIDPKSQFETYLSKELIIYIDDIYRTVASAKGRAITGFSMGGHGGLWLGINHPNVFGACGSISGGVDIRPFPDSWDMKTRLGSYAENEEVWDNHTVINQLEKIEPNTLSIIFDCGVDDFFYEVNENLHKKMLELKIPHDYIVRPGKHDHDYWNNALDYQFLFFSKFFNR